MTVRTVSGEAERARWDALMRDHHYLGFRGMIGNGLRHVAERSDGVWVALLGWQAGSYKLAARDRWIGWTPEQRLRRLHLVANNTRFVILPGCSEPNLASRVLGQSLRRLSRDMHSVHGHPVLVAEALALDCFSILRNSSLLGKVMKIRHLLELGIFLPVPLRRARWT